MLIASINHVGISVPCLTKAKRFYCDVLGLAIVDEHTFEASDAVDRITALSGASAKSMLLDGGNIFLEIFEFTSPGDRGESNRPVSHFGYTHLAFEVSLAEIDDLYQLLAREGVKWHCELIENPGTEPMKMCYGRDPFGNVIEIQGLQSGSSFSNRNRIKA